jgi:hypothetical protein
MLTSAYSEECSPRAGLFEWHKTQDDERISRPSISRTEEFVPGEQTVNGKFYKGVIKRLVARVHLFRPEFQESGSWYLLQDNAPTHFSDVVSEFLARRVITCYHIHPTPLVYCSLDSLFSKLKMR